METPENKKQRNCIKCGSFANSRCNRCCDYYCSETCQKLDWSTHRFKCFPMPELVPICENGKADDIVPVEPPLTGDTEPSYVEGIRTMVQAVTKTLRTVERLLKRITVDNEFQSTHLVGQSRKIEELSDSSSTYESIKNFSPYSDIENDAFDSRIAEVNDSLLSVKNSLFHPMDRDLVLLRTFLSSNRCVISKHDSETNKARRAIINCIQKYGENAPKMETLPEPGTMCISATHGKQYSRAKIIKIESEGRIKSLLCDFGFVVEHKLSELRVISPEIASLPALVQIVQLYAIHMIKYSNEFCQFRKQFLGKVYRIEYFCGNRRVKLCDIANGQMLNDAFRNFIAEEFFQQKISLTHVKGQSSANKKNKNDKNLNGNIQNTSKPKSVIESNDEKDDLNGVMTPPFETYILSADLNNEKAIVVDTSFICSGYFACILKKNLKYLTEINNFLSRNDFGDKPYKPMKDEYCIVYSDDHWCRGKVVISHSDEKYGICLVDFYNNEVFGSENIRPYPMDLKTGCYTTLCKLHGFSKGVTDVQLEYLKSYFQINKDITINRVVEIMDNEIARIECTDFLKGLNERKSREDFYA